MVKNPPVKQETQVSIPGPARSLGEGNGHPLQYSCLGNPWTETGGLQPTGVAQSRTRLMQLSSSSSSKLLSLHFDREGNFR